MSNMVCGVDTGVGEELRQKLRTSFPGWHIMNFTYSQTNDVTPIVHLGSSIPVYGSGRLSFSLNVYRCLGRHEEISDPASCWRRILHQYSIHTEGSNENTRYMVHYEFRGDGDLWKFIDDNLPQIKSEMWDGVFYDQVDEACSEV